MFYTYMWLREDGTPYYVGKGSGRRAYQNKDHCVKHPQHKHRVLISYWGSEEEAFSIEKWWIRFWGRKDLGTGILRNMTDGGDGPSGWVPSDETKAKIKKARQHQTFSKETREKMRIAHTGLKKSEETKAKIRTSTKMAKPRTWKHGSLTGYKKYRCQCELCKKAINEYLKEKTK